MKLFGLKTKQADTNKKLSGETRKEKVDFLPKSKYDIAVVASAAIVLILSFAFQVGLLFGIYYAFLIASILWFGNSRLKSMCCWITSEAGLALYYCITGAEFTTIIQSTGAGILIALVGLFLSERNAKVINENYNKPYKIGMVYEGCILVIYVSSLMCYIASIGRVSFDQTGVVSAMLAIWYLTPTFANISKCAYTRLTYIFQFIYFVDIIAISIKFRELTSMSHPSFWVNILIVAAIIISFVKLKVSLKEHKMMPEENKENKN